MKKAFTLIELLIVVAIIAILAAIAVPNFLEAQTRAKVSRVMSDQRTYATALGTYQIDNSSYPMWYAPSASLGGNPPTGHPAGIAMNINEALVTAMGGSVSNEDKTRYKNMASFAYKAQNGTNPPVSLTTPVSYLNTYVPDTFAGVKGVTFGYAAGPAGFLMTSAGPDGRENLWFNTGGGFPENKALEAFVHGGQSLPSPFLIAGPVGVASPGNPTPSGNAAYTYDASNGTQSDGDVYRTQ